MQTSALRPQISYWAANEIAPVACVFPWTLPRSQLIWEEWHLVTLLLHQCGFLPLRCPLWAVTKCNLCFSCVILRDQSLRQHVWRGISGLRKKARCDVNFFIIHICHFYLTLWVNVLFSPTAKFKISAFALPDIPLEPQIRCKISMLIISCSPRQQRRCQQHRKCNIFWPPYISKYRTTFPINEMLSERAFCFWREKKPYPCIIQCMRWTKDTYIFCNSQWGVLVLPVQRVFLHCFPARGKAKITDA